MSIGPKRSLLRASRKVNQGLAKKTYKVNNFSITVAAAGAGVGFGTAPLFALPQGNVLFLGAVSYLKFETSDTDLTATFTSNYGIGTSADANGTLAGAEMDLITDTSNGAAVARVSPVVRAVTANTSGVIASPVIYDNTAATLNANLNLVITAADITDATSAVITVNGVVHIAYLILGDD